MQNQNNPENNNLSSSTGGESAFSNNCLQTIIQQLQDCYDGDPWFGRSVKALLGDVTTEMAFEKPTSQHSIVQLLWHMIIWREFTISRLDKENEQPLDYFEKNDWVELDHSDKSLWQKGLQRLDETQAVLIKLLSEQSDDILEQQVAERTYDFRKLLYGMIQHDIYHLGQIAYIIKLLKDKFK